MADIVARLLASPSDNLAIIDCKRRTEVDVLPLIDYLVAHPNTVSMLYMDHNQLSTKAAMGLARFLATSKTVTFLHLAANGFNDDAAMYIADALRVNTSLRVLDLYGNNITERESVDDAFIEAMRVNPERKSDSWWQLYEYGVGDFSRLRRVAGSSRASF